jgi:peptide/nickel transport system substrate-binding protein
MRLAASIGLAALCCCAAAGPGQSETKVRIARGALPATLGVPFSAVGQPSSEVWIALFDGLTRIDPGGVLQPALAQSWEFIAPSTWRFRLRPGVTFHNGVPLNADAVIASLEILRSPSGAKYYVAQEFDHVVALRPVDGMTVDIETAKPDALLPHKMSMIFIVEPRAWAERGEDGFAQRPVGTGPFKLVDWGRSSGATRLGAFSGSWRRPVIDAVELYTVVEPIRRVQALLSGQVDIATRLGPEEIGALPAKDFAVITLEKSQVMSLTFVVAGNDSSPVADVRVRRALSMAVDRKRIVESVLENRVAPASQAATAVTNGFDPSLSVLAYDPQESRRLLAEAGHADGFDMQIDVFLGQLPADELIYQQVAQSFRDVGVRVALRAVTYAQWLQKYSSADWGDTDAFGNAWDSGGTYDVARPIEMTSCRKARPFFCDPSVMPLLGDVEREMDPARRLALLRRLNRDMRDRVPAIWILNVVDTYAASRRIKDLKVWHMGLSYEDLALAQ